MKTSDILKYRSAWLGFAMIWIVWCHANLTPTFSPLVFLKGIGYGGVDICLFASGLGCYFSLTKDPDHLHFYKRRILRLFPAYFCFIVLWILWKCVSGPIPLRAVWGNLLGIQSLTGVGGDFNWYIGALFLFYLLSPLLKDIAQSLKGLPSCILATLFLISLSIPFWTSTTYMITVTRLPLYFMGMLFGRYCQTHTELPGKWIGILLAASAAGVAVLYVCYRRLPHLLWSHGLHWYPFILITPGLCAAISFALHLLHNSGFGRAVFAVLNKIGQYSFELFVMHALTFEVTRYLISPLAYIPDSPGVWCAAILLSIIGCVSLHYCARPIHKLLASRLHTGRQN